MNAEITELPIDSCAVLARVGSDEDGAVLLFIGNVRRTNDGRAVTGMRYHAYREMAERVLGDIVAEATAQAGDARMYAVHRIGELGLGEASVAIAVSSPHRAEAYAASRYVIEEIKKRLPVWKQEFYQTGEREWLSGEQPPVAEGAHHE